MTSTVQKRESADGPASDLLQIGIDWITGVFPSENDARLECIADMLEEYFGERSDSPGQRGWVFRDGVSFALDGGCGLYILRVPGVPLRTLRFTDQLALVELILCMGGHCTRIDVALDDTRKAIHLPNVVKAAYDGTAVGYKRFIEHRSGKCGCGASNAAIGITFGLAGKLGGLKQVIFYDKGLESEVCTHPGEWIRIEARFFKENAQKVAEKLLGASLPAGVEILSSLIAGSIDFLDGDSTHLDRRKRLEWWQQTIDALRTSVTVRPDQRKLTTAADHFKWDVKSVAPGLKAFEAVHGPNFWMILMDAVSRASGGANGVKRQASIRTLGLDGLRRLLDDLTGRNLESEPEKSQQILLPIARRIDFSRFFGWGVFKLAGY